MFSGAKLRFYRYKTGRTQDELARAVGVTSAYLSNVEHGKRIPSPSVMETLAQELSVCIEELWDDDGTMPSIPIGTSGKGILLEHSEGTSKTRLVLPPTPESYALIAQELSGWKKPLDSNLRYIVDCWEEADDETKRRILEVCGQIKPPIQA
jgi:transcriptional regulator with XRE-family HTH domain